MSSYMNELQKHFGKIINGPNFKKFARIIPYSLCEKELCKIALIKFPTIIELIPYRNDIEFIKTVVLENIDILDTQYVLTHFNVEDIMTPKLIENLILSHQKTSGNFIKFIPQKMLTPEIYKFILKNGDYYTKTIVPNTVLTELCTREYYSNILKHGNLENIELMDIPKNYRDKEMIVSYVKNTCSDDTILNSIIEIFRGSAFLGFTTDVDFVFDILSSFRGRKKCMKYIINEGKSCDVNYFLEKIDVTDRLKIIEKLHKLNIYYETGDLYKKHLYVSDCELAFKLCVNYDIHGMEPYFVREFIVHNDTHVYRLQSKYWDLAIQLSGAHTHIVIELFNNLALNSCSELTPIWGRIVEILRLNHDPNIINYLLTSDSFKDNICMYWNIYKTFRMYINAHANFINGLFENNEINQIIIESYELISDYI